MRFICFSSGAQQRYRDDVVRAMAMPSGCELTFRYRLKYLATAVRDNLDKRRVGQGDEILICYLDQSERTRPVDFVPVRFATLIEAPVIGDFVVLRMRVRQFAYAENLDFFNEEVRSRSAEVPRWPPDSSSQYATGAFCLEVDNYPKSVVESTSIANWQITAGHLLKRKDFAATGPFYQVVRMQALSGEAVVVMAEGEYALQPGTEYELIIDHFLPGEEAGRFQLETAFSGSGLTFVTGSTMQIDSPYDRHWVRFKTEEPLKDERAVITIKKKAAGEDPAVQFDLPISVKGRLLKALLMGLAVGLLLAVPQITTVWMNPAFSSKSGSWFTGMIVFIVFFDFVVGVAAAMNFSSPI